MRRCDSVVMSAPASNLAGYPGVPSLCVVSPWAPAEPSRNHRLADHLSHQAPIAVITAMITRMPTAKTA